MSNLHAMIRQAISPLASSIEKLGAENNAIEREAGNAMTRIQEVMKALEKQQHIIEQVVVKQGEMIISGQKEATTKHGQVSQDVGYLGKEVYTQKQQQDSTLVSIQQEFIYAKQKYDELRAKCEILEKESESLKKPTDTGTAERRKWGKAPIEEPSSSSHQNNPLYQGEDDRNLRGSLGG